MRNTTITMHTKTDSEVTSIEASTPPRSPRRPLYYVQSPSHSHRENIDHLDKMSYGSGSSPFGSPTHHNHFQYYHCSPIHHSRESSTSRIFSGGSLKNPRNSGGGWRMMGQRKYNEVGDAIDDDEENNGGENEIIEEDGGQLRFYVVCFVLSFVVLFGSFALILWGSSLAYKPEIIVQSIVFENLNVQAGMDSTGVPTDMLTLNSTVRIFYRNPATFFGVHVTATPLELHYFDLKVASGHMKKFYQSRKSGRNVITVVRGHQVPLYGGIPLLTVTKGSNNINVPLNLTFVMRSRAYILGNLVKTKFRRSVSCEVTLRGGNHLGKPHNFTRSQSCVYR